MFEQLHVSDLARKVDFIPENMPHTEVLRRDSYFPVVD